MKRAQLSEVAHTNAADIPYQETSLDIWDKKYRLKAKDGSFIDQDIDATYQRVAQAIAEVETTKEKQKFWKKEFLWALRHGAIPAGRIISNAGAQQHKPATSTINCTVSGTIHDSMNDILNKVHEAGLTLKAGCVAAGTLVRTEHGMVTADIAVNHKHQQILCFDRESKQFEMRHIEQHLTTHVSRHENIEIISNGTSLKTSIKHPVLVCRNDSLKYVRADHVKHDDALLHYHLPWTADTSRSLDAWFAGAYLADGSSDEKYYKYGSNRSAWVLRAYKTGKRLVFKIRAVEKKIVERYATFFKEFGHSPTGVIATQANNETTVWDYNVSSFATSQAVMLIDHQFAKNTKTLGIPVWVTEHPEQYFLPFLAGLIDTYATVSKDQGSVTITMQNKQFAQQLKSLLGLFAVHAAITIGQPRDHEYNSHMINGHAGFMLKISDSDFLQKVAEFMADSGKRFRIHKYASNSGQYDRYVMTTALRDALQNEIDALSHIERQQQGFYDDYHQAKVISRVWLDRWQQRFPHLTELIRLVRILRPVDAINRNLRLSETFYDFTVEKHNNYLAGNHGLMVIHNCGIGYEYSTLRPKGAYVSGAGAYTSGPLSFMDIYDKMCFTVSSAGGRRGAQMATFDIGHPDAADFIRAKREDGRLRQFNLSLLITKEFMQAVQQDANWSLAFPISETEAEIDGVDIYDPKQVVWRDWPIKSDYICNDDGLVACLIYKVMPAKRMWDMIMASTYDFAEPGFILIDKINEMNNNWFVENIRATNPCGEQPLPAYGSCLLGSINLTKFVRDPFTEDAIFDWDEYKKVTAIFTRLLDNVVEINGLPLTEQRHEIEYKRRHGMGFLGLGSTMTMLRMKYGSKKSLDFTNKVSRELALTGWEVGVELAKEKGPAAIMDEVFEVTSEMLHKRPEMKKDGYKVGDKIQGKVLLSQYSRYMQKIADIAPNLVAEMAEVGARFTHHTSIAPTGTISLSLANNASNGIEPSFAHNYSRNVIREGRKSKEKVDVFSFELLAYRQLVNPLAMPFSDDESSRLPDYFISADDIHPKQHVDVQAAAQSWIDSSISKTANVPTDYPYEDFKDIYRYAYEKGLKGCTTFRFNPEAFQGVLVKEKDLQDTLYKFTLDDGSMVEVKGNEEIEYDGEMHSAANLFDALKEGYYGKF